MEKWKAIPGYEGIYEASNHGRIRTAEGKTTSSARFQHRVWKQRIMKLKYEYRKTGGHKDARVCLWKDGKEKTLLVSRLVAMAWCDGYSDGMTVNHKDGNPLNNNSENLEWVSISENINHAFDNVLMPQKPCTLVSESGEKRWFRSQCEASRSIGRTQSYIAQCLSKGRPIRSISGEHYGLV